jgi:hypothetical protein
MTSASMLAVELDHYHLRMAPLRPLPALMWLAAVPAGHRVASIELAWLPMLFVPGSTTGVWLGGAVLIPCLVALLEAGGALAVVVADRMLGRAMLRAALTALGVLPAAASLLAAALLGWPAGLAAVAAAAAVLAPAAVFLLLADHRIWPSWRLTSRPGEGV